MVVAIDFDGTCVSGYPKFVDIGAAPVLKKLQNRGALLILNTCRVGQELSEAEQWFKSHNIKLNGTNKILATKSESPKVVADLYIDDRALGCPHIRGKFGLCVDWITVSHMLGILTPQLAEEIKEELENVTVR